jgi:hypothetical protein
MAKVIITLEDNTDRVTVSMDMAGAPTNLLGMPQPTRAVQMSQTLFDLAAVDAKLSGLPACARQPSNMTIH